MIFYLTKSFKIVVLNIVFFSYKIFKGKIMNRIISILLSIITMQLLIFAYVKFVYEETKSTPSATPSSKMAYVSYPLTHKYMKIEEEALQPKEIATKIASLPLTVQTKESNERQEIETLQQEIQALVKGSKELTNIQSIQSCLATLPPIMIQENLPKTPKSSPKKFKQTLKKPSILQKIEKYAKAKLGNRYVWGATGPNNFDCSGFTKEVFHSTLGINIPRVSREQAKFGKRVEFKDLRRGDMVFFDTEKKFSKRVNHVGIYLSNGRFIHASSAKKKVVITSFRKKPFYKKRFLWGRRVVNSKS